MTEHFLHYLWKFRLIENPLLTTQGERVTIVKPGEHNSDAGPDFSNARIRIGTTLWAGNVEVHLKSSDWIRHKHHVDEAYQNIILHAVLEHDREIFRTNGEPIPTVILQGKFDPLLYERYRDLSENLNWIPCEKLIGAVDPLVIESTLPRMMVERLERRSAYFESVYQSCGNDWEETFYRLLARNFGFRLNAEPFELLAKSLPMKIVAKQRDDLFQTEALFFGQAGMLKKRYRDDYPKRLTKEYRFLRKKYTLTPIDGHLWKFLRLRPSNFPTIRISQFAGILCKSKRLVSEILGAETMATLKPIFESAGSDYWMTHYIFDRPSVQKAKNLGDKTIDLLLINTIIPFIYFHGEKRDNPRLMESSLDFFTSLTREMNITVKKWMETGMKAENAFTTQALMELKENYCDQKKCLECRIGHVVLNSSSNT
ncbi:MAG: DUF2851 family protein [Bacteroidetes bacterium]|nr:DUF2851 family protein [Bacteroidota bacterium]